jgi:hypothetical protein
MRIRMAPLTLSAMSHVHALLVLNFYITLCTMHYQYVHCITQNIQQRPQQQFVGCAHVSRDSASAKHNCGSFTLFFFQY